MQERDKGGQVTVFGTGGKTCAELLSDATFTALAALRPENAGSDDPVFCSRKGRRLGVMQVRRIVKAAAARAAFAGKVSPNRLWHAGVSHALDREASAVLVRDTVVHSSIVTTNACAHARPGESNARYLAV